MAPSEEDRAVPDMKNQLKGRPFSNMIIVAA